MCYGLLRFDYGREVAGSVGWPARLWITLTHRFWLSQSNPPESRLGQIESVFSDEFNMSTDETVQEYNSDETGNTMCLIANLIHKQVGHPTWNMSNNQTFLLQPLIMPLIHSQCSQNLIEQEHRITLAIQTVKNQEISSIHEAAHHFQVPCSILQYCLTNDVFHSESCPNNHQIVLIRREIASKMNTLNEFSWSSPPSLLLYKKWPIHYLWVVTHESISV